MQSCIYDMHQYIRLHRFICAASNLQTERRLLSRVLPRVDLYSNRFAQYETLSHQMHWLCESICWFLCLCRQCSRDKSSLVTGRWSLVGLSSCTHAQTRTLAVITMAWLWLHTKQCILNTAYYLKERVVCKTMLVMQWYAFQSVGCFTFVTS